MLSATSPDDGVIPGSSVLAVEELLRELAPQVLGALVRRYGHFDSAEDAVQEALLAAATQWPAEGVPDNPRAWLITVGSRRLTDLLRSEESRRRREDTVALQTPVQAFVSPAADAGLSAGPDADSDDTLIVLFMCCHPVLTPASQVSLTLRAVGGLTTDEIARAFLVPETTMAQRISRAKQTVKKSGQPFALPPASERAERLKAVLHVLYLIFNEGYTSTSGSTLHRVELSAEAIRLARMVHRMLPDDGEVAGLLALMLLTDARRPARTKADGSLVPLEEQDRGLWLKEYIDEGVDLVTNALSTTKLGAYQLQAAIAAIHDEAARPEDTDWRQIVALYELLEAMPGGGGVNPMVRLNRAVAVAMVDGPQAGLGVVAALDADQRMAGHHRLHAVRAHLLELAGDLPAAREHYLEAAKGTTSLPEQRYLLSRADRLGTDSGS
ncbi:RNA polymerase sigma factor [Flindersiella endophytica]